MHVLYAYALYRIPAYKNKSAIFFGSIYSNLSWNAIVIMIAEEHERPIMVSKVKYLGSCLLPSPMGVETTIMLYLNSIYAPELDATISTDKISEVELAKGKDLPSEAIMMFGVVGLIVEKESP